MTSYWGNIRKSALRQTGHRAGKVNCPRQPWYCSGCRKNHSPGVAKFVTLDGQTMCLTHFAKEQP